MVLAVDFTRVIVRRSVASAAEWDRFAQQCCASFRSAYAAARAWQFEYHALFRLYRWDILLVTSVSERKIGQCAVGVSRDCSVFSDGIQLLPYQVDRWSSAMAAVLRRMGPASYIYGSEWSSEPPREQSLESIGGVSIDQVRSTSVQIIDFKRWKTLEDYRRAVSTNVRRNVRKAEKSYHTLQLVVKTNLARLHYSVKSIALRRNLFQRKGINRSMAGMVLRSAARLVSMARYSRSAYLIADGALLASYVGINFGQQFCYLEGASDPAGKGTAWYLLMAMIEQAYIQTGGQGQFVMGSDDGSQAGVESWEGLRRSRKQCCAAPFATSIVHFTYVASSQNNQNDEDTTDDPIHCDRPPKKRRRRVPQLSLWIRLGLRGARS